MRILVAGNLANMGFEIVKALRDKGADVNLLMPKYPQKSEDPQFMYPEIENTGYPKWIITYDNKKRKFGLSNWKFQIIKEMRNNYDCIIALTELSIFAMLSGKPYGALSTGSDMRELPFEKSLKGFLYKLSYKFARVVIWGETDKYNLIKKLGIEQKAVFCTNPRNFDFNIQNIKKEEEILNKIIIFHPTSQDWRLKGNNEFLNAFVKLCSENENIFLIISERGPDLNKAKKILEENVSKEKYKFVPLLNSTLMQYYFNLSDIVIDQFKIGSIGMISVEAMKYGKPIFSYINRKNFNQCYKNYPEGIINVETCEEILSELKRMCKNFLLCKEMGEKNKKWIDQNWNFSILTERYLKICNAIKEDNINLVGNQSKLE